MKDPTVDPTIIGYFKFNDDFGMVRDEVSNTNGTPSGNVEMLTSNAPVGLGMSDLVFLDGLDTYEFPNSQTKLIFNSGTPPDGELVVTHLVNEPTVKPTFDRSLIAGYYIINAYPKINPSTPLPQEIHFQSAGVISNYMSSNSSLATHTRSQNEGSGTWTSLTVPSYELISGLAGQIRITDASPITAYGQIALGRDKFADGSGNVTIKTEESISSLIEGGGSAELSLIAPYQAFTIPSMTDVEVQSLGSPIAGSMVYDNVLKSVVYFDGTSWNKAIAKATFDAPKGSVPIISTSTSLASDVVYGSVLNLSEVQGAVILPKFSSGDLVNIETPSKSMMIYNTDENKIQVYQSASWQSVSSEALLYSVGAGSASSVLGIGIGQDDIHSTAALEITSSNNKTLSLPVGDHREQNDAIAGSIMFSVVYNSFMVFDGEVWNRMEVK